MVLKRGVICVLLGCRKLLHIIHQSRKKVECCNVGLNYKLQCYYIYLCFLTYVPQKISEKNFLETSNIALFTREIYNILSEGRFYLKKTDLGRNFTRETVNLGKEHFFRDHIILVAEIKDHS